MKRVQAIVSGNKKKQCTKLPSPAQPPTAQPSKGKTSATSPKDVPVASNNNNKKGKVKISHPTPTDKGVVAVVAGGNDGGANAAASANVSTPSTPAVSVDNTAPKTTSKSASTTQAASTTTTAITTTTTTTSPTSSSGGNRSPGSRTPSRIPASSPKKTRDVSGTPSGKGRLRLESEEKPKKKPSLIRKLSLKDKNKSDGRKKSKSDSTSDRSEPGGSSTGYVSSGEETKSKAADDTRSRAASRSEGEVESQVSVSTRSSNDSRTITPQPSLNQFSDSSSQLRGSNSTIGKEDKDEKAGEEKVTGTSKDLPVVSNPGVANGQQKPQGPAPVNAGYNNGPSASTQQQHIYGSVRRTHSANVPASRDGSRPLVQGQRPTVPRGHPRANGDAMMYRQAYASLPRSSRATTPTGEDIYSYGTLPRRSNSSTPTPQTMAYQNNIYGTVGGSSSWGTLSREGSSDSGFNMHPNNERGRAGRPVNGNYYAPGYPQDYRRLPRAGSVPPADTDGPDSIYCLARPDSVPPVYYSDGEYGRYQQPPRGMRAGSVPLGYESESSAYADGPRGGVPRNYESDSGNDERPSGLRAGSEDERYRAGPGKRPMPRRHTLGAPNKDRRGDAETERKREAFMNLLAQRYPQYADRIQGSSSGPSTPIPQQQQHQQQQQQPPIEKPARAREPQRRRTAVVSYDPARATNTLEYDDLGTMSDLELPSFQRGNYMRTSLPIVRSASTSLERPLGLVFLVYGDQTKKSMLPNEITTLDTVRALFVRAFSNLTMEMLEETRKKIYILDKNSNIYFQLEDLAEIMDKSVLKLHDTDNEEPQRVRERQEVRGRTIQMPLSKPHPRQDNPDFIKSHSLPPQASQDYQELMHDQRHQLEMERRSRSRSRTPEPTERPRFSHSPDRLPTPERGPLNPIPENRQLTPGYREQAGNYYETIGPSSPAAHRGQYQSGIYEALPPAQYQTYANPALVQSQQPYTARGPRAATMVHPQRPMGPIYDTRDGVRASAPVRHNMAYGALPLTSAEPTYQRSQSYRIPTERDQEYARSLSATPTDNKTKNRIEKMEAQLASLTAWVHYQKTDTQQRREQPRGPRSLGSTASDSSDTFPASSASSLSDIPSGQKPSGEVPPKSVPAEISNKLSKLKSDLHTLKRQQQLNMESMREEFMSAFSQIKTMCSTVSGAENQVNFKSRNDMTEHKKLYLHDKEQVTQELHDLESTVEELRNDVISRKCRVNISDVEGMALLLSTITKNLADLKARFPELQEKMKNVMDVEMQVVVSEEKFLKEEPVEIEGSLKRCKKLTETLYTLKRLASVQDHRPPNVPNLNSIPDGMGDSDQKKVLLENIRAMVPDHDQRVQQMEAADASRERKKKISTQQEALKFGKSLEIASKALRPPSTSDDKMPAFEEEVDGKDQPKSSSVPNDDHVPARSKSPVTIKSTSSAPTHPPVYSHPLTSNVSTGIATSVTATSVAMAKSSFSSTLTSAAKPAEQQEVKESVTSTSGSTFQMNPKPSHSQPLAAGKATASLPLTQTTERLSSQVQGGTGPVAVTFTTNEANKRPASSSATSHSIRPPVYSKPNTMGALMRKERIAPLADKEDFADPIRERPKSSPNPQVQSSNPKMVSTKSFDECENKKAETNGHVNGHSNDSENQAASPAIYNSVNSPSKSSSTSSPARRNSVETSAGSVAKVTPGGTINLILSGSVSPKSPTDPGMFTISPPIEIISSATKVESSPSQMPSTPVKKEMSLSDDSSSVSGSPAHGDSNTKQKKVPPPPPPRKGSRPTSVSGLPTVNGGVGHHQQQEMPQFVGGILGQHRLSGGPLSSTPKPSSQQRTMSTFEKDIASGIYANLNRPDLQSQNSSPQQMINQVSSTASTKSQENLPPAPSLSSNTVDREERGSSSESTSSSSGTSMGSQQSVVNITRTGSLNVRSTKPKPEPPRRQSSLLSKSSCPPMRDTLVHDRKKTLNGVDL